MLTASTRFVWDKNALVHEIRRSAAAAGDSIVEERNYCCDDGAIPAAWAHQDAVRDATAQRQIGPWYHYLSSPVGAPELLVEADGAPASTFRRSALGVPQTDEEED